MAVRVSVYGTANMKQITAARYELDRLEATATRNSRTFGGAMTRMSESAGKIGQSLSNVGSSMTRNLTLPIAAAAAGLYKATENAAKDAQAQVILAGALRNNAGATQQAIAATEEWITAQGKALGISDDELRPSLATLVGATKDVAKAQQLAALAMDVAAARGVPVETASKAIAKAYAGQTSQLTKLVPGIDQAAVKSKDFGQIMASVSGIVGGQASAAAGTMAGQMQRNKVAFDEATESLGNAFMPIMTDLSKIISEQIVPAIQRVAAWFAKLDDGTKRTIVGVTLLIGVLGPLTSILGALFQGVSSVASGLAFMSKQAVAAAGGLMNFWTGLTNASAGASAFATPMMRLGGVIRTGAIATGQFVAALGASVVTGVRATATWVAQTAALVAHKAATVATTVASRVAAAAQWLWNAALTANPIGLVIVAVAALVAGIVLLATRVKGVGQFFSQAWANIKNAVSTGINAVANFLKNFVGTMTNLASNIVDGFLKGLAGFGKKAWDAITAPIRNAVDGVKNLLGIASPSKVTDEIGQNIGDGFNNGIAAKADLINSTVSGIATSTTNTLNGALANVDRAAVVSKLSSLGLLSKMQKFAKVTPKELTDAVLGDEGAWNAVNQKLTGIMIKFNESINSEGVVTTPWQKRQAQNLRTQLEGLKAEFAAMGDENSLQQAALGDTIVTNSKTTVAKVDTAAKALAEKLRNAAALAKDAMKAWAMDDVVKPITTSFDQMLTAIGTQIQATANFINNIAALKKRGLNAGALSSILEMGAAQGGGFAAALAGATQAELNQYNKSFGEQQRLTSTLGLIQAGAKNVAPVTIAPGAVQVSIAGNADTATVTDAMKVAIDAMVRELRSR